MIGKKSTAAQKRRRERHLSFYFFPLFFSCLLSPSFFSFIFFLLFCELFSHSATDNWIEEKMINLSFGGTEKERFIGKEETSRLRAPKRWRRLSLAEKFELASIG